MCLVSLSDQLRVPLLSGVATTTVTCDEDGSHDETEDARPLINVVQRGPGSINTVSELRWGDYSAAQVVNGQLWYVVPIPVFNEFRGMFWMGSWISVLDL